jgi:hypothetical protein
MDYGSVRRDGGAWFAMSTRVGIISEGPIDPILVRPLLERIARKKAGYTWPLTNEDYAETLPIRKRGHGGVLEMVRKLVAILDAEPPRYDIVVILLDHKTAPAQDEIKTLIRGKDRFVLGIAIEEIEAWWLADRKNTLTWADLKEADLGDDARFCMDHKTGKHDRRKYKAEEDPNPKLTLDEITRISDKCDRYYGEGSVDLAEEFVLGHWGNAAPVDQIASQCPQGFGCFMREMTNEFRSAKARAK